MTSIEASGTATPPSDREALNSSGRFARNAAALVIGRFAIAIAGWTGTVLIARELTTEQFGQFTLVFAILGMLAIVTDLGVGRIAVAALLDEDEEADRSTFAGTYVLLRTLLGVIGYAVAVAVVWLGGFPGPVQTATLVGGLVVLLATPSHAYEIAFQVKNRLAPLAVASALGKFAQLALTVALVLRGGTLVWFVVPAVLNDLVILIWKVPAAHKLVHFRYRVDLRIWLALLKEAVPLSLGAAFVTLYYRFDSVMLSKLDTFESVGSYGVAYKFVDLVHFVPSAVAVALLAPLTAAASEAPAQFHERVRHSLRLLGFAAGPALVGFWLFADEAATLLYGDDYNNVGLATAILVTGEALAFGSTVGITALIAVNRHRWYPMITLTGLLLNIGLNLWLIPLYSFEGAAAATLATELVVVVLLWRRLHHIAGWGDANHLRTLAPLVPSVGGGAAIGLIAEQFVPWIVAAGLAVVGYAAFAWLLRFRPTMSDL